MIQNAETYISFAPRLRHTRCNQDLLKADIGIVCAVWSQLRTVPSVRVEVSSR